jgi:CheY-like chemotaxis protein
VDDDPDARDLVALTLESRGAVIQMASSAAEALESINRERPDVVVADIGMPLEDGYVLIQKLRAIEKQHARNRLSAIALTAFASAADRDQALASGFDVHLTKPVGPAELIQAVASYRKVLGA